MVVLLGGLLVGLHTSPARRMVLRQVAQILADQGIGFQASQLDYNLFGIRLELRDVRVASRQTPDLPPIFTADRVWAKIDLARLIRGVYDVDDGGIDNPAVRVVVDRDGRDNIPRPPAKTPPSPSSAALDYLIRHFRIAGGSAQMEERRQQIAVSLPLDNVTVAGDAATRNHEIRLQTRPGGEVKLAARTLPIGSLSGDLVLEKDALAIRQFGVALGDSQLGLSGRVNSLSSPSLDLRSEATLGLESLVRFAGQTEVVRGNVHVALTAAGPLAALRATVRVRGENLVADRFDHVNMEATAAYDSASARARLDKLDVTVPWGRIHAQGAVALSNPPGESTAKMTVEGCDLNRLSTILKLPVRLASTANAGVDARWKGLDAESADVDATVRLSRSQAGAGQNVLPVAAAIRTTVRGNRIVASIDSAEALGVAASGEVLLLDRKSLKGNLSVGAARLSSTIAAAEVFLGKAAGSLVGTPTEGTLASTVKLTGTVTEPGAAVSMQIPDLSAGDLQDIAVNAGVRYAPELMSIDTASVAWQNQTLTASGTVGLGAKQALNLNARADGLSIGAILQGLKHADVPLAGDFSLVANVTGTVDNPQADVSLNGNSLAAYGENFEALVAKAQLRGPQATVSELELDKLRASGTYNTATKQYSFQAHAQDWVLSHLKLPGDTEVRGTVNLDASGSGVSDNPAADLKLAVDGIQVGEQQYGHVELAAKAANQKVDMQAAAPKFGVTATGNVGIPAPNAAWFDVRLTQTDLSQLPVKLDPPVEGTISAVIHAAGDLQNFEKGTAKAEVSQLDVKYNGEAIRTEGPLVASFANGTAMIERATILAADSRVDVSGSLPLEASSSDGAVQLKVGLNLAGVERLLAADQKLGLRGTVTAEGTIRGNLKRIDPQMTVQADACSEKAKACATAHAQIRNGAVEIQSLTAKMGDASLNASGNVPFALLPPDLPVELPRMQGPARLTADLQVPTLSTINGVPANVSGKVTAHIEAEASKPELGAVKATLTFPELQAAFDTYAVTQKGSSQIALENGTLRIGQFQLIGPATELTLSGTAEIAGQQALDLHLDGKLDASLAAAFTKGLRAGGATEIHASVSGSANQPQAKGYVQLSDAQIALDDPRVGIEGLNLRIDLDETRATLSKLEGQINGGTLAGKGAVGFAGGKLQDTDLSVETSEMYLDFPAGLKTVSDVKLQLKSVEDHLALGGSVLIKEGGLTENLYFDKGILAAVTAPRSLDLTAQRNPMLESLSLNVAVATQDPIAIQNNLAKAELSMQLRVLGNPYDMGLTGRLTIEEGSQITLQERQYSVNRGVITFTGERSIEPSLDIEATTTVSSYDITLDITGPPNDTKTQLTSDPAGLSEPDIMALLVTGRTLDEIRGQEMQVAQAQMLSYLTGRLGGSLGHQLEKATGLSQVRVEPNLIADEAASPGVRLTVGQNITRQLNLVYSMDLVNSSDQIYVAEYDLTKRFVTRGVRQSDGSYRFDFRHDLRFGGMAQPKKTRREVRRVGEVQIAGAKYFTDQQVESKLKIKPGSRYDFFKVRRGMDRVVSMYTKANLLEASVRLRREQKDNLVNLNLKIDPGVKVDFAFEGVSVPGHVEKELRRVWDSGVFDTQRVEDATAALRSWLVSEKHLAAQIRPQLSTPEPERKHVLFDIQPGPKFEKVEWVFAGANGLGQKELRDVVESQKLATEVYTKPSQVTDLLTRFYYEMGYLDATVGAPAYSLVTDTATGTVTFPVKEGPHYLVGEAHFSGNTALTAAELAAAAPLPKGEGYRPSLRENSLQRLRTAYWAKGYNDVELDTTIERIPERGVVNLSFHVTQNIQGVVKDIVVEGNRDTSEKMILSQLDLKPGDPVNLTKIGQTRKKLYNTGAYAIVDISREDVAAEAGATLPANTKLVRLRVHVQEVQPFDLRYGGYYDTERGPGGIVDFSVRNLLGSARLLEFIGRYDSELHDARVSFSQPLFGRLPVKLIATPYIRREINPETSLTSAFNVDRLGFTLQQELTLAHKIVLDYGYKIERSHTYDTGPDPILDVRLRVASLTSSFTRDTRDDILDATKGSFQSHAFEFSPEWLGTQVSFVKYLAQYFRYIPLQKPRVQLFTNKVIRPRLVYATAVRVGLAGGLGGQEVPLSERFFAGGSTTLRGFAQDSVGPIVAGTALGGSGMLILNNEIRFPLVSVLDGVGFVDVGNVYARLSNFDPTDLRKAAGLGLRVRTPWVLLRLDWGFNLDRRMGEPGSRLFFSIGQAF